MPLIAPKTKLSSSIMLMLILGIVFLAFAAFRSIGAYRFIYGGRPVTDGLQNAFCLVFMLVIGFVSFLIAISGLYFTIKACILRHELSKAQ